MVMVARCSPRVAVLLAHGTLAVDAVFASDEGFGPSARFGVDGRAYVKYGLGLPIVELPFVAVALLISRFAGLAEAQALAGVLAVLNPVLTTCTAIAVFSLCRSLDCEPCFVRTNGGGLFGGAPSRVPLRGLTGSNPFHAFV